MCKIIVALLVLFATAAPTASAAEPFDDFLEALYERGHFDLALKYLDKMATSDLATSNVRDEIDFRRGLLHVRSARSVTGAGIRQHRLNNAEAMFESFLEKHPDHPSSGLARGQLGNVVVERGRSLMKQAASGGPNAASLTERASEIFSKAEDLLEQSRQDLAKRLGPMEGSRDPDEIKLRSELREQYVSAKLARARVLFEHSDALKGDEQKYREKLTEAATAFDDLAQKYRTRSAGVYAVLYEGQCYQRMGEHHRALSYFKELLQTNDKSPAIRRLKTKALTYSIESWLTDEKRGHDLAIETTTEWLKTTRAGENDDPNWDALRLGLARAYARKSIAEDNKSKSGRALSEAKKIARELSTRRGPHRSEAQELLVQLGVNSDDTVAVAVMNPESVSGFNDAFDAAKKAVDEMRIASRGIAIISGQIGNIPDADADQKAEMSRRLDEMRKKETEASTQAMLLFQRADSLATPEDINDHNTVRYFLSYLYYTQKDYRRAAVLAEFVATHHSESVAAKECATFALAAHQTIYKSLDEAARPRQADRIGRIAELMILKWPNSPQAGNAITSLLNVTVQQGDLEKAEKYLAQIPESSPARAAAELQTGQAIWSAYLKAAKAAQDNSDTAPETLMALKQRGADMLERGMSRLGSAEPTEVTIRSALSLAQIHVDSGETHKAIEVLKHPQVGPLTLVESESPWVQRIPGLAVETYKLAIRSYVASAANAEDTAAEIAKAQEILDRLRQQLGGDDQGKQAMINIYVGLAKDLETQLSIAPPETKRALSAGFESFLKSAGQSSDDPTILKWVADTQFSMGKGFRNGSQETPESLSYFNAASRAYERILELAKTNADNVSASLVEQVQVRQAMAMRSIGKRDQAMSLFAKVLAGRENVVNIQVEAAKTLQSMGDFGTPDSYLKAIRGTGPRKSGKNLIWGWGRVATVVGRPEVLQKSASYRDTLYDARFNIALCHYNYAIKMANQKEEFLKRAKQDIVVTHSLYRMRDERVIKRFEDLLKLIQKNLGEAVVGFGQGEV